jgi:hypothetical protein
VHTHRSLHWQSFHEETMQRLGFPLITRIALGGMALGLSALASASNLPEQGILSPASLRPSAATHETRTRLQEIIQFPNANKVTPRIETVSWSPPTRSSFMATWGAVSGAKGYLLDVSTSNSFNSYVHGYHDLDVGNVNGRAVNGLNPGTTYYYRVRPYTAAGSGGYSNVMTATTEAPTGLIINPTFDDSIITDPNSAAIEAMINRAIGIYESLFSDPITIQILFRYSDTAPNNDPLPPDVIAASLSVVYTVSWNDFVSALKADARTGNDNVANTSLPGSALSTNIMPSSGNGRAVGLNTPPAMFPDGTIGLGGPYDGIVTLNSAQPFQFIRPPSSGSFDAQRSTEHEIDEVIGLGSYLNTSSAPTPCPSYEAESSDNTLTGGAVVQSCPTCSGGAEVRFVGNNSGTLQFNGVTVNTPGRYSMTIWYLNGDPVRYALMSVNGAQGTPLSFPSTGSFQTVGSIQVTVTLNAGSNTLEFYNPIVGDWAPDFDRIEMDCTLPPPTNLRPQDLFSWSSPGVRNLTTDGSRYFSIDSGNTNIVGFNQFAPGDFGDWLSEACPQPNPYVQNAFACLNQFSDISATSPEGINLDVIGYNLGTTPIPTPIPTPTPAPILDSCYPNFTTAEGCDALSSLTTGAGNTALGWRSLFLNTDGSFNTAVGGGALTLNNGSSNTAVGAAALLLNTTGTQNTAVGTDALVFNDSGSDNAASGYFALMNNTTGGSNTATGWEALTANASGNNNTAVGNLALESSETTSDNVAVGRMAGSGITAANNNIIIGHHSGVHSVFGEESDRCFIDNIHGAPVSAATAAIVMVDSDGRLGTVTADGPNPGGFSPKGIRPKAIPDAAQQTVLDLQVQDLEATVVQRQQQIETLTAQLKKQAAQIQNVNAQLEMRKSSAKMIVNKPKAVPPGRVHGQLEQ